MRLKSAILQVMDRDQLKRALDDLELNADRRNAKVMTQRLSRARRANPDFLLERLSEPQVKEVCEELGMPSRGRRAELIATLLAPGSEALRDDEGPESAGENEEDAPRGAPEQYSAELPEGVEDLVLEPEETGGADTLTEPFNSANIRIEAKTMTVDLLVKRIQQSEIDLSPAFQRQAGIWKDVAQSRLIESLLVRIPLPAFYVDATNDERWLVVDGLQRLTVFRRFVADQSLRLCGLEFLHEYDQYSYSELPRPMQRRIDETQVTVFLMLPGTDPGVKFHIFKRINTGGLPLSPQEIRHALFQGPATEMLQRLVNIDAFHRVAGESLQAQRMTDREMVLRFLAFILTPPQEYPGGDLNSFLNTAMETINKSSQSQIETLEKRFVRAMETAHGIFGNDAFRKRTARDAPRKPISKALFEAWSVNLDRCRDGEIERLLARCETLKSAFIELMVNDRDFAQAISQGTGDKAKVQKRFGAIRQIIDEVLS